MSNESHVSSGGVVVSVYDEGLSGTGEGPMGIEIGSALDVALAIHYQQRRDKELGRWRDPENPNVVIEYDAENDWAYALDETTWAECAMVVRDSPRLSQPSAMYKAISNFFKAHPKPPKPWEEAQTGEVWVLTRWGTAESFLVTNGEFTSTDLAVAIDLDDDSITAGYRIWPNKED